MFEFITYGTEKLQTFLLVAFRAGGLFIMAPVFAHRTIPPLIKAGFAIMLAIMLVPVASRVPLPQITSVWQLTLFAAKEMLIGVIIGLFFSLLFFAVRITGNIVGYQVGLIMANIFDPNSNSQFSMVSEFYFVLATLLFLAIDGHHAVISALADSYKIVPLGVFNFTGPAGELLIRFSAYAFTVAIKIGAPVIITLFIMEVALGVVARTVPQMNIFLVGIPLKIGVGFLVLSIALPVFRFMVEKTIGYLDREVMTVLYSIGTT
ncbi:MAG: flagellar type III secretion system protein FliR [Candidatus Zixiibacteriota bacterium]|nr:MAG: flagellar type III secretion system protein FliR [candidate division Zixibacteria bacterium]